MGVLDLLDEECKVCVQGLSQRKEPSAVLLLGLTGKSHLHTVVILALCWCKNWESLQTELAITGGEIFFFLVMNSPPLPLHHISVTVPRCLVNFVWTLTVFSSSKISECSPWSCQISPNCLLLGVSLFFLGLFYAKPCTGDGSECLPQWKPSLGFLFITKHHKKSLMEVDEFCSVW